MSKVRLDLQESRTVNLIKVAHLLEDTMATFGWLKPDDPGFTGVVPTTFTQRGLRQTLLLLMVPNHNKMGWYHRPQMGEAKQAI